jgi:fructose-specific component phosphotransferase system IIB-like protein
VQGGEEEPNSVGAPHVQAVVAGWPLAGSFQYLIAHDRWVWSDGVAQMFGYAPGSVTPSTELILTHTHAADRPAVAALIEQVRHTGAPFSSRHRIVDTAGAVHLVVVVGDRLHDDDGELTGTSGFYVDVTEDFEEDVQRSLDQVIGEIARRRAVINQAIGMLMLAHGVTAERAFEILAWRSQETNVKLRDIAERLVAEASKAALLPDGLACRLDHLLLTVHERVGR